MPNWILAAAAVVAVLAAGLLRERWRIRAIERSAKRHGLAVQTPFVPGDRPPMKALAAQLEGHDARIWGVGLTGAIDGHEVAIAEHETPARGQNASGSMRLSGVWRVVAAWPAPGGPFDDAARASWPHGGELAAADGWAAWRMRGTLTPATLERILAHLPEARRLSEPR